MRSMVEGGKPHAPPCARAPSVGFAATSPVKNGGGSAKCDRPALKGRGMVFASPHHLRGMRKGSIACTQGAVNRSIDRLSCTAVTRCPSKWVSITERL